MDTGLSGFERREVNADLNVQGVTSWREERENKCNMSVSTSATFLHKSIFKMQPGAMKIKDSLAFENKPDTQNLPKYMDNMVNKIDCRASYMETCIYEQPGVLICYILVQNHYECFYILSKCFLDCSEEINSFVPPHTRFHSYQWLAENSDG